MQYKLVIIKCITYLPGVTQLIFRADIVLRVKILVWQTITLGSLHSALCIGQQTFFVGTVFRKTGNSQCQINAHLFALVGERHIKRIHDLGDNPLCCYPGIINRLQQNTKLIATKPRQRIRLTYNGVESVSHIAQQHISHIMTKCVVVHLELVNIERNNDDLRPRDTP